MAIGGKEKENPEPRMSVSPALNFEFIFQRLPGLYLVLDVNFRIVAVSDAYLQATLTVRDNVIGRGIFEVFPDNPDDPSADGVHHLKTSLIRVLQSGMADAMAVQKYDVRRPEGDGFALRYWSPMNSPVLGEDGKVAYIIHRAEDVTEFVQLKQREGEQGRHTAALQERASQMESEIYTRGREVAAANVRLKEANDELESLYRKTRELDELKTQFFANISHELRTPLTLVDGPVGKCLRRADLPDDVRRDLEMVRRNIRLLHHHVDDLLDIAKLEAGRMKLEYAELDLVKLIRFLGAHFESLAEEKKIDYALHLPDSLIAQVDVEKYQRILLNLLSNAFKFTPEGGRIEVTLVEQDDRVALMVEDNGPGIPEKMRGLVFERFRQMDGGLQRQHGGTGLGLSIVREFAQLQGGAAAVAAGETGGALFIVSLPRTAPSGTPLQPPPPLLDEVANRHLAGLPPGPGHDAGSDDIAGPDDRPLVLVVEDNADLNAFICDALGKYFRVVSAFDGQEGLERAVALHPSLIVSDIMMPRMSGDQMILDLRSRKDMEEIPIIVLTAKSDEELRVKLLRKKVQDYLGKPFSDEVLLARAIGLTTDWRRTAKALHDRETRFRATFEQAAVGIAHVAPDGRWLQVNHRFCAILGYSQDELLERNFRDLVHPDDAAIDDVRFKALLADQSAAFTQDKRYLRRDGSSIWTAQTVSLVLDDAAQPAYFIVVIEDIQRRKDAEAEVLSLNADLERRIAERTLALQMANHELESFSYAVSHDLRAPVRAMLGFGQAVVEECGNALSAEGQAYLEEIIKAATQMGELINGLLTLSRCTRNELRRDRIDLTALAGRIVRDLAMAEPGRRVEMQIAPDLFAHGDGSMIEAALRNLLGNAWKYTAKTPAPAVRFFKEEQDGQTVFCVSDNGAGFDLKHADKLFKPFSRLHRQDEFPGIGVGLATVQRIVVRHGGAIQAYGVPNQGATFKFSLPDPRPEESI